MSRGDEKGLKGSSDSRQKNSLLPAHNRVMFEMKKTLKNYTQTNCLDRNPVAGGRLGDGTFKDTAHNH